MRGTCIIHLSRDRAAENISEWAASERVALRGGRCSKLSQFVLLNKQCRLEPIGFSAHLSISHAKASSLRFKTTGGKKLVHSCSSEPQQNMLTFAPSWISHVSVLTSWGWAKQCFQGLHSKKSKPERASSFIWWLHLHINNPLPSNLSCELTRELHSSEDNGRTRLRKLDKARGRSGRSTHRIRWNQVCWWRTGDCVSRPFWPWSLSRSSKSAATWDEKSHLYCYRLTDINPGAGCCEICLCLVTRSSQVCPLLCGGDRTWRLVHCLHWLLSGRRFKGRNLQHCCCSLVWLLDDALSND